MSFLDKIALTNPSLKFDSENPIIPGLKPPELTMTTEELRNTNCQMILQTT